MIVGPASVLVGAVGISRVGAVGGTTVVSVSVGRSIFI